MTLWSGSSLLLQPSSTSVVTTAAQIWPGKLTCRHMQWAAAGVNSVWDKAEGSSTKTWPRGPHT